MSKEKKEVERKKLFRNLKDKYRLVLLKDETFEERFALRLNRLQGMAVVAGGLILFTGTVLAMLILTPLREFIPGYADSDIRYYAYNSSIKADSMSQVLSERQAYIDNLMRALNDSIAFDSVESTRAITELPDQADLAAGNAELVLREKVDRENALLLSSTPTEGAMGNLSNSVLFPPLNGMVTAGFDISIEHYGIDVVSTEEDAVKSVLDGTVILASWTYDTGYVIQVQHRNNIISVYKHNAVLLKEVGDRVSGGEAIAIVGNSGELTDGPHLHFELWNDGRPVDPLEYLVIG